MGNYRDLETDFIDRTLQLISQYEIDKFKYDFDHQFNHTLLINCLLGLIVLAKEKTISVLPNDRLTLELRKIMGVPYSEFNPDITTLKGLIIRLRHSIAHFNISVVSDDPFEYLIDRIVFVDLIEGTEVIIASFYPNELLDFVRYFGGWIMSNIKKAKEIGRLK